MCLWSLWVEIVEHPSVSDMGSQHCAIVEIVEIQMSQYFFKITLPMTIECPNLETSLSAGLSEFYLFGATTNVENPLKMLMFHNVSSEIELGPKFIFVTKKFYVH